MPLVSDSSVLMGVSPAAANSSFMPSIAQVEFFFQFLVFFKSVTIVMERQREGSKLVEHTWLECKGEMSVRSHVGCSTNMGRWKSVQGLGHWCTAPKIRKIYLEMKLRLFCCIAFAEYLFSIFGTVHFAVWVWQRIWFGRFFVYFTASKQVGRGR